MSSCHETQRPRDGERRTDKTEIVIVCVIAIKGGN